MSAAAIPSRATRKTIRGRSSTASPSAARRSPLATTLDLKLPDYQLVNIGAGIEFPDELEISVYVNNLLDENALLAFDRERGGRARLGFATNQPRTFGVTVRKGF